jgi:hypothetical protein
MEHISREAEIALPVYLCLAWDSNVNKRIYSIFRYIEDPNFEENIKVFESLKKHLICGYFEEDLDCSLPNITDLYAGSGSGTAHIFNPQQLQTLISQCRDVIFSTGDIEPLSESTGDPASETIGSFVLEERSEPAITNPPRPAVSYEPAMETGQREANGAKKKHHVKFQSDHVTHHVTDSVTTVDDQIKPLAACTVAAAMVGAAAEHLNISRKASSAGMRAANATAKVARAVANGDAETATDALSEVVKIVDGLSNTLKQKGDGSSPKSKTCVIL